jgi:diacylglycerol O-acyltransferase / wax synthase
MTHARLSALDTSFLTAESPNAHMHVGWAARFDPPADGGPVPGFAEVREHVAARLHLAPRYRQRLAPVPLGLCTPEWVDDEDFDLERHVVQCPATDLAEAIEAALSAPLDRSRPLWELWVCDRLADGRLGLVGKVHHCMVDGLAAVELGALLLDPSPDPPDRDADEWTPERAPGPLELLARGARDRLRGGLELARVPARLATAPGRALADTRRMVSALVHIGPPARPHGVLNEPISPLRHLGTVMRDLDELRAIKTRFGVSLNDVLLAACAGGMRRFLLGRGELPEPLKAMVPVNVRDDGGADALGNRISFLFIALPCDEPDPVLRLMSVHAAMHRRKVDGSPRATEAMLDALRLAPQVVQKAATRVVSSPRTFNLVVSNIPGPPVPLYLLGCRLTETYPVVPLADRHALSIGFTSLAGRACFGLYADRAALPDVDALGTEVEREVDALATLAEARGRMVRELVPA